MDGKCGHITRMEQTFQSIKQPDIITYTTMAKAYIINVCFIDNLSLMNDYVLGFTRSSIDCLRSFERK